MTLMCSLTSSDENHKEYQAYLATVQLPAIPSLHITLEELAITEKDPLQNWFERLQSIARIRNLMATFQPSFLLYNTEFPVHGHAELLESLFSVPTKI